MSEIDDHPTKRVKLSTAPSPLNTLASRIGSHAYHSIEELLADVDTASSSLENCKSSSKASVDGSQLAVSNSDKVSISVQVSGFRRTLDDIIRRVMAKAPQDLGKASEKPTQPTKDTVVVQENQKLIVLSSTESTGKLVLTLYGNAPIPRQLFSSLQQPANPSLSKATQASDIDLNIDGGTFQLANGAAVPYIRESALPNGITTTKIIPAHSEDIGVEQEQNITFGDIFAPPSSVPALNPPKQSRHTATRSQSVNWYNPTEASAPLRSRGRESYTTQPLSAGRWLSYNVVPSPTQLSSPGEKRKQRDRALSSGDSKASLPEELVAAYECKKDDALFKSVYSSFAPNHDDAIAIVPQKLKNRLWWDRVGEKRWSKIRATSSAEVLEDKVETLNGADPSIVFDEDEAFKEAVETWEPVETPFEHGLTQKLATNDEKLNRDVDEILGEITQLLETLSSYQSIRNLSLATNARTTAGHNPQLTAMSGSPTSPSSAEFDVYDILKSQLVLMISALPPYAVAKLNSDQLGALNISTRVRVQGKKHKGIMEENDFGSKARPPSVSATSASAVRLTTTQVSAAGRTPNYQGTTTPATRTSYAGTARANAPSATYPSHQYSNRPSAAGQYGTYSSQQPSSTSRNSYSAHQYGPLTTHNNQYPNGHRQYPAQNGYTSYTPQYGATQSTTSATPIAGSHYQQRPSQPGYQQRAQNSQAYTYGAAGSARSTSPQNRAAYNTPAQARPSYTPSSMTQSQPRAQFYQNSAQSNTVAASSAHTNGAPGTIGQHISLTDAEQAEIMLRQKQMIAAQAQIAGARQGSSTPQPANGTEGGHTNGTTTSQVNGVPVTQGA